MPSKLTRKRRHHCFPKRGENKNICQFCHFKKARKKSQNWAFFPIFLNFSPLNHSPEFKVRKLLSSSAAAERKTATRLWRISPERSWNIRKCCCCCCCCCWAPPWLPTMRTRPPPPPPTGGGGATGRGRVRKSAIISHTNMYRRHYHYFFKFSLSSPSSPSTTPGARAPAASRKGNRLFC